MKNRVGEPTKLDFKTSQKPRKCGIGQTCKSRNRMGCVWGGGNSHIHIWINSLSDILKKTKLLGQETDQGLGGREV